MQQSYDLAKELVNKLLENFDDTEGDFGMLVNGMGATPLMEQYILLMMFVSY